MSQPRKTFRAPAEGFSPLVSGLAVAGAIAAITWSGARFSPAPNHPRTLRWYLSLRKPAFTPPGAVFGLGWSLIEAGLAFGGYRLLRKPATPWRNAAVGLWAVNNALIAGWSALFFGRKALGASTLAAGGMIGAAGAYAAVADRIDRPAAASALPLIGWLGFATLLAEEVWRRNET
ncbi:MAG: tryptophan-rich sensory protein [Caulobacteraceae bacterium]|nr:tryptophan-rich sensory protein [Caulobacter sp.]